MDRTGTMPPSWPGAGATKRKRGRKAPERIRTNWQSAMNSKKAQLLRGRGRHGRRRKSCADNVAQGASEWDLLALYAARRCSIRFYASCRERKVSSAAGWKISTGTIRSRGASEEMIHSRTWRRFARIATWLSTGSFSIPSLGREFAASQNHEGS
jgi:hypothetical protein